MLKKKKVKRNWTLLPTPLQPFLQTVSTSWGEAAQPCSGGCSQGAPVLCSTEVGRGHQRAHGQRATAREEGCLRRWEMPRSQERRAI